MKHKFLYPKLFFTLILIYFSACRFAYADNITFEDTLEGEFEYVMELRQAEYFYHAQKWGDSKKFSAERDQYLVTEMEEDYFAKNHAKELSNHFFLPYYPPSMRFAKMFMHYGVDFVPSKTNSRSPLIRVVSQVRIAEPEEEIIGDEFNMAYGLLYESAGAHYTWGSSLSPNQSIALAKLYLALGVDIHAMGENGAGEPINALTHSFTRYRDVYDIPAPDPNPLPDYYQLPPPSDEGSVAYRKSKVTYWLEEFIAADYPASMLDTHSLHYPRFMKDASVAQVTEMLKNPDAHKIPANINCPYKAEAVDCPLTPSINMRDAMGRTPLHIAGEQGNKAVFDTLITLGADKTIKDYRGLLPKL